MSIYQVEKSYRFRGNEDFKKRTGRMLYFRYSHTENCMNYKVCRRLIGICIAKANTSS